MARKSRGPAVALTAYRPLRAERSADQRTAPNRVAHLLDGAPIKRGILEILRARGGRLWMVDLVFELRWRGVSADVVHRELAELAEWRLVRGPLSEMLAYELTPDGWDLTRRT